MTTQTVACPQCQTTLRSKRPLSPTDMIRCPQCGNHFLGTSSSFAEAEPIPQSTGPLSSGRPLLLLLIPAVLAALLLGAGAVLGTYFLVRSRPAPTPVANNDQERRLAEEKRRQEDEEQRIAREREKLIEEKRRLQFDHLMDDGRKYLADKKYDEATTSYQHALDLYPKDKDALDGLVAAKAGKGSATVDIGVGEDKKKRQAAFDKLMVQGQQAMTAKKYADAIIFFETAQSLIPGEDAFQALAAARKELDKDKVEKEKLAGYQKFMAAGKAALESGRYADAIREFLGAQGVIPADAAAVKGQKDAEQKLADAKDQTAVDKLVADGQTALREKRFRDANAVALAALRILPGDPAATKLVDDAKKAYDAAMVDYKKLLAAADNARFAQRYEEAKGLYTQAQQVLPGEPGAQKGLQDLQNLFDGQAAYNRFMTVGTNALAANRYGDAANAFAEALRLVPNDPDAAKGLTIAQAALARIADYERFMTIATVAMNKKQYNDAVAAYRDALIAVPDDPLALAGRKQAKYLRAMAEGDKEMTAIPKKFTEAIAAYEEALKEKPGDKAAKEQISMARYQRAIQDGTAFMVAKKFADAVPQFEDALKERPKDVDATIKLHDSKFGRAMAEGDAAMKAMKYDDAISAYQDALKEKPNENKATKALEQARKLKKQ